MRAASTSSGVVGFLGVDDIDDDVVVVEKPRRRCGAADALLALSIRIGENKVVVMRLLLPTAMLQRE